MTNILKDVWEDRSAAPVGCRRRSLVGMASTWTSQSGSSREQVSTPGCASWSGWHTLTCVTPCFTLLIPRRGDGHPALLPVGDRTCSADAAQHRAHSGIHVGRPSEGTPVGGAMTQLLSNFAVRNDWLLRRLFERAAAGLPRARLSAPRAPDRSAVSHAEATAGYSYSASPVRQLGARRSRLLAVESHFPRCQFDLAATRAAAQERAPLRPRGSLTARHWIGRSMQPATLWPAHRTSAAFGFSSSRQTARFPRNTF